ncbi:MAG: phytoene/squalene synthase family protein [Roseiflexaceae bacterium]|nr:phytoene/squalene synthase family protein [Roseiflexaceae bacterium]
MSLSHPSGWGAVQGDERTAVFKEAGILLAELREIADLDPSTHVHEHVPESFRLTLQESYCACEAITRQYSKSFFFSSQLLPPEKRKAVRALYAFCRTSDDLVDHPGDELARALATWVELVHAPQPPNNHPVLLAWSDTAQRHAIPMALVDELLAGIAMDLSISRYATFDELWVYCYRVASVVGLLSMQIIGYQNGASPYAVKLGVALQLTNILRDVGEDACRGRIYLPHEDLARFGLTDADILAGCCDQRFRALMQFEIARAHQLYEEAWAGIPMLNPDSQLAIGAAAEVYRAILGNIEQNDYDVFTRRAHVPFLKKLWILWNVRCRLEQKPA